VAARASLIEDGGAGAASNGDFFRSPRFLAAEGVTHSLHVETGHSESVLPVIVRNVPGSERVDAVSPYGYPGGSVTGAGAADPGAVDWSQTGLVSLFVRDRIGEPPTLAGGTIRSEVQIADPLRATGIRKRLREQIRRNERLGWKVHARAGPETSQAEREAFRRAYSETMARTGAASRYLYSSEYFGSLLEGEGIWLLLAVRGDDPPSAGAIAVWSDGYLHYFLGGTAEEALPSSPMKNLFAAMIELAGELGRPLNLGGGVRPGDSLEGFKRGFANGSAPFRTHEVVCDPQSYDSLTAAAGTADRARPDVGEDFFPAYRAPAD
jgi:hypothetical protein